MAVTARHRRVVGALVSAVVASALAWYPAGAADGDLDPTFGAGGTGKVVADFGAEESARGVAIQADGRIVVAGTGCGGDILVARFLPDGTPDPGFDDDGRVCIDVGSGSTDAGEEVLLGPGGTLLVAGTSNGDFALVRLTSTGALDPAFAGGTGKVTFGFPGEAVLRDAALGPDGSIALVGEVSLAGCAGVPGPTPGQTVGVAVARSLPAGAPDPAFGTGGTGTVVRFDPSAVQRGIAVAVQANGSLVVGGRTSSCSRVAIDELLFRLTALGQPDAGFTPAPLLSAGGPETVSDLAVLPDGRLVVVLDTFVGPATTPEHDDAFTVARLQPSGALDVVFELALFGAGANATPNAVALQGNKVVVAGSVNGDFAVARWNADGTLDPTFSGDGKVVTDLGATDSANAVAVQPDGKVVAAGQSGGNVALVRYGTTSTATTVAPPTTVTPGLFGVCAILDRIRATFLATPLLAPYVAIIDAVRVPFGCG